MVEYNNNDNTINIKILAKNILKNFGTLKEKQISYTVHSGSHAIYTRNH